MSDREFETAAEMGAMLEDARVQIEALRASLAEAQREWKNEADGKNIFIRALAAEREHADALADLLADLAEHGRDCIRSRFEGGRPTAGGGYESRFAGVWYENLPVDRMPPCTCGLIALLDAHDARRAAKSAPAFDYDEAARQFFRDTVTEHTNYYATHWTDETTAKLSSAMRKVARGEMPDLTIYAERGAPASAPQSTTKGA